ncbi:Serine/threonine-protein kinase PrkC [Symmachiella macrocystis]|uniref:Serine/threonine-protein kinase PrkC n=1 Tax=Symmachiella macrocystis TaxID=2527985 RepID=A0A5C6BMQ0_9PLAN|nr:serine/threonine-protein kinase [Symmachiella macrocystis]TWU12566.1 Serine/threonine-protein kinase PrkC [Symmachiella macrocystis]
MNVKSRSKPHAETPPEESSGGEYLVYGLIAEQVEQFLDEGRSIDVSGIVKQYPHLERQIRDLIPSLAALHQIGPAEQDRETRSLGGFRNGRRTMLGDFALGREIGRGGMGVVYEAMQVSLGRRVALKVLPFAAVLDKRQLQRFKNEAQAAAALHHPHIVPVFAVGCERGVHYYAMQYIEGRDLSDAIVQLRHLCVGAAADADAQALQSSSAGGFDRGRMFYRTVAQIGVQAAEALEYAHQRGIVHRDIKPSNLMLDSEGEIWVADFGLAQIETDATLTGTGDLVGTLRYMSPEQISDRPTDVDHRCDIFALGATLYELATLQPLYTSETRAELLRERTRHDPVSPRTLEPSIPQDLETIILKAIAKHKQARYATAEDLAADLRRFLNNEPIAARPPNLLARVTTWSKRHQKWVAAAAILICGCLVFAAGRTLAPRRAHQARSDNQAVPRVVQDVRPLEIKQPKVAEPTNQEPAEVAQDVALPTMQLPESLRPVITEIAGVIARVQQQSNVEESQNQGPSAVDVAADRDVQPPPQPIAQPFAVPDSTPPPPLDFRVESDQVAYVGLVKNLLEEGLGQSGKSAVEAAEQYAVEARRLCNNDPRLDYALGLVNLKNFRPSEALEHFTAAKHRADYPYLPAEQAEIWYLLSRKEYEPGLDRLAQLVKTLSDSPAAWPDTATRTNTAHWVGRVVAFLQGPGSGRKVDKALQRPGMDFRESLSASYRPAYDAGQLMTQLNHQQLQTRVDDIRKDTQTAQLDKRNEKQEELADRREELAGQQNDIKRDAKQWKEWLEDQTSQADEKLNELEKEYITLEEQDKSLRRSIQSLQYEIQLYRQSGPDIGSGNARETSFGNGDVTRRRLFTLQDQMMRYHAQLHAVWRQASIVNRNAQTVMNERRTAERRYEKETGTFLEKNVKLEKWTKRLKRQEERLKANPVVTSAELTDAERRLGILRSYVDLDWGDLQRQILKTYQAAGSNVDSPAQTDAD